MTKKDYIRAANMIKLDDSKGKTRAKLIDTFVRFFEGDNPRFDETSFREACSK